jgi:hypothetical protein
MSFSLATFAQNIPGSVTGAQVPDSVAYRMVFLALSTPRSPTPTDLTVQKGYASAIGLSDEDVVALLKDTKNFRNDYAVAYAQVDDARPYTLPVFLARRVDLVTETHASLVRDLTPDGMAAFEAFVQGEKDRIETVLPHDAAAQ